MTEGARVPKLRFKGFNAPWEEHSLGQLLKYEQPQKYIVDSSNFNQKFATPVLTAGKSFLLGYTDETEGIKQSCDENPVIIFDDFMVSSHFVDFPFKVKSSALKILSSTSDLYDTHFLFNLLNTINYRPQTHERHWISKFSSFLVSIPSSEEQHQISILLKRIESLIYLGEKKYEKLVELKQAMLQKMFPREGETVPELRFPGFTYTWKTCLISDFATIGNGRDYKHLSVGSVPVYGTGGYMLSVDEALSYDKDAVGIGRKGTIDKPFILKAPFWTVDTLFFITPIKQNNLSFLFAHFQKINWKELDESTGVPSLAKETINSVELDVPPTIEEQEAIGQFFTALDDRIAKMSRRVDKLKQLKQALLEKMFV